MVNKDLREYLQEIESEAIIFDNPSFDNSIVGFSTDGAIIYSMELMINELAEEDEISADSALEFIEYNTLRTMPYINDGIAPIIIDCDYIWMEYGHNKLLKEE